ncbi:MAG: glycosyltransferase family 9 protein [Pseudomonadota bacterium]
MKKILFITSSHMEDAVLSTGVLDYLAKTYPASEITVACRPPEKDFFRSFPRVAHVFVLEKEPLGGHWRRLWQWAMHTYWDIVVDLCKAPVSKLILSRKKYIWNAPPKGLHKIQQFADVLKLNTAKPPAPKLYFSDEDLKYARAFLGSRKDKILAIDPAADWIGKTWPLENYIELLTRLMAPEQPFENWRIAVLADPGQEDAGHSMLDALPGKQRIDLVGKTSPMQAASCISLCDYYLGNETALMHCAVASNVPVMGVFGPSCAETYRPWGKQNRYVSTPESCDELTNFKGYDPKKLGHSLMESLTVDTVERAIREHLNDVLKP